MEGIDWMKYRDDSKDKIQQLESDLKEANGQLASIKTLNRQAVEKILRYNFSRLFISYNPVVLEDSERCVEQAITAILDLAIPEIDKDRIIKVLGQYKIYAIEPSFGGEFNIIPEAIAQEIITAIKEG